MPTTPRVTVLRPDSGPRDPYSEAWPQYRELVWVAQEVAQVTGLSVTVTHHGDNRYSLSLRGPRTLAGNGPMTFREACAYLDGVKATHTVLTGLTDGQPRPQAPARG